MSQTIRVPRAYKSGRIARVLDGLRYGGGIGQWSWLAHRLSGLGILFFLIVHITDTFFVVFAPDWYDHTVAIYGGIWFDGHYYWPLRWAFRIGELGLIASVVFHAVNGVGVILYDLWPKGTLYRRPILWTIQLVFWGIMLITTPIVLYPLRKAPDHPAETAETPLREKMDNEVGPIVTPRSAR
jgi:succinate dehydrogenase / fumarate reductase cytochrome b subunit